MNTILIEYIFYYSYHTEYRGIVVVTIYMHIYINNYKYGHL